MSLGSKILFSLCAAAAFIALQACDVGASYSASKCPPRGTTLTYESFGEGFLARRCQTCHGDNVEDRQGAPSKYSFDSPADVHRWIADIYDDSAGDNTSMPPGPDDPPLSERENLAEWLACGAP
jgi:hypothetical protein